MVIAAKKKIINASLWIVGVYGLSQLLRLGSNLIVTRLLEPEMFGLMVIVQIIMHGLAMLSDLGLWAFVVRHKTGVETGMLNTVWTIQVIRGWVMFILLTLLVLVFVGVKHTLHLNLTGVYGESTLPYVLIIIGFTAIIRGYTTMAPAILSRELKRGRLELIELASQFFGALVMIVWALQQSTIWALVSAGIVGSVVNLFLTYKVFHYRHHFSWDKKVVKEVFDFGKWIVLASILTYIALQGDRLFFGVYISPAQLGVYGIAFMIASVVTTLFQQLTFKVWFPLLGETVHVDRESLKSVYYKIRLKNDLIVFTAAGGLIAIGPSLINFLYDVRYHEAGWMLQILAISIIGEGLLNVGMECLSALGITKYRVKVMFIRSVFLLVGLPFAFNWFGFVGGVYWTAINVFVGLPVLYIELYRSNIFSLSQEIKWLPMAIVGYVFGSIFI